MKTSEKFKAALSSPEVILHVLVLVIMVSLLIGLNTLVWKIVFIL